MPLNIPTITDFTDPSTTEAIYKARLTSLLTELQNNAAALADVRGVKNRLINGDFRVTQRSGAGTDGSYCIDRWYALMESTFGLGSQQTNQEAGSPCSLRMQNNNSAMRIGVAQAIESLNCRDLRGGAAMLSARIRCSAAQAIRYAVLEHTGTADTITRDVVNNWSSGSYTAGGFFIAGVNVLAVGAVTPAAATWTSITLPVTVGASANNVIVVFWTEATIVTNGTLDLGRVQFEAGTVATPFEIRGYANELNACLRYNQKASVATGRWTTTTNFVGVGGFMVPMRKAPTVTSGLGNVDEILTAGPTNRAVSASTLTASAIDYTFILTTAAATSGSTGVINSTSAGYLLLDAEL